MQNPDRNRKFYHKAEMPKSGKGAYQSTEVLRWDDPDARLRPPASLQGLERQAFLDVVLSCPAAQFRPADLPLLCRWAELCVLCETAMAEMTAGGMVTSDGKVSSWFSIYERSTKALAGLALRLRLGPQSRAFKAPKKDAGPASFYDRMTLLEGDDDGDEAEAEADNKAQ